MNYKDVVAPYIYLKRHIHEYLIVLPSAEPIDIAYDTDSIPKPSKMYVLVYENIFKFNKVTEEWSYKFIGIKEK